MALDPSHKARLNWRAVEHFPGDTLFEKVARAVCEAGCLPRKELYESWEMAKRVRRRFRGGRVIDLAAGHGLLAYLCQLLDSTTTAAVAIDRRRPQSADSIAEVMEAVWPQLQVQYMENERSLGEACEDLGLCGDDVIVSAHACGALTDEVLALARTVNARVAVLPCCHDVKRRGHSFLHGWLDGALAMDVMRAVKMQEAGYHVVTQSIPEEITPKHRLLLCQPPERS